MVENLVMAGRLLHVLTLVINLVVPATNAATLTVVDTLYNDVIANVSSTMRPVIDQSTAVNVNISMSLGAIHEVDLISGHISVVGMVFLAWQDERIQWDPSAYGNAASVLVAPEKIWYPELVLANPADKVRRLGKAGFFYIRIFHTGMAKWNPAQVFKSTCSFDITYFPFDFQTCELDFFPVNYYVNEVKLTPSTDKIGRGVYSENGEWILSDTAAMAAEKGVSIAKFRLVLRRRHLSFLVNVVLPVVFLGLLNTLVFLLPADSGEKVSYAVTVLLALAVFMTLVGDNMPGTSKPMPIISYFLLMMVVYSVLMMILTILIMRIQNKSQNDTVPKFLAYFVRLLGIGSRRINVTNPSREVSQKVDNEPYSDDENIDGTGTLGDNLNNGPIDVTWIDVAMLLNTFLFFTFLGLVTITCTVFLLICYAHQLA